MNPPAFQHPDDGWYMIEPAGEHPHPAAGVVQVIDAPAMAAIVRRFQAEARQPDFAGLLVDQDHFSREPDKATRAFGWLMALRALPEPAGAAGGVVCNRAEARPPAAPAAGAREARHREVHALMRAQGCDFETAWNLARAARPELFAS